MIGKPIPSGNGGYTLIGSVVNQKGDFTAHTDPQFYNANKTITSLFSSIINGNYDEVNIIVRATGLDSIYWTSFIVTTGTYPINAFADIKNTNMQLFLPMPGQTANFTHFIIMSTSLSDVTANMRISSNFYDLMTNNTEITYMFYVK